MCALRHVGQKSREQVRLSPSGSPSGAGSPSGDGKRMLLHVWEEVVPSSREKVREGMSAQGGADVG
jgi:hypothetical protein